MNLDPSFFKLDPTKRCSTFLRSGCWRRHFASSKVVRGCEQEQTSKLQDSYLRLVNGQTGEERVERGPAAARPDKREQRGKVAQALKVGGCRKLATHALPDWHARFWFDRGCGANAC